MRTLIGFTLGFIFGGALGVMLTAIIISGRK